MGNVNSIYLLPSTAASAFLLSISFYLFLTKIKQKYILPLIFFCLSNFLWNVGNILANLTDGQILWAEISTIGLIFIPATIFHFAAEYTNFFRKKYYLLLAYIPSIALFILLLLEFYVTDVTYKKIGYEAEYDAAIFFIHSWIGFFFVLLSTFMLYRYYKENVGVKKKQSLYILIAIPSNAVFSFLSYIVMEEMLNMAQFPLGSTLDFLTLLLILYAIVRFKLPVETPAEIDFRILAETATEGICIVDRARRIEYANDYLCKMFCISKNKILGKNFFEFVAENYRDKCEEKCKEVLRKGNTIRGLEVIFECGEKKIIGEINASPIKWNNEIIGCFITIRDIGEKKRMEEELRRQKTYFQALFESSPEAIVSLDEKHRVMDINKAFRNLFGYSIEELKGKNIDDFILPPEEERKGREISKKVMSGEVIKTEGVRKRKDGSLVQVSILGAPIFIDGKQIGIFGIYRDITDRKRAEEEREFYNSLLRHDIANKLTIIQGNLEILKDTPLNEEQKNILADVFKALEASNQLIDTIRKLHASREKKKVPMDLHEVLKKVIESHTQHAQSNGIEIEYMPMKGKVMANSLIENVFSNIIHNAIVHSGCNKIKIHGGYDEEKKMYRVVIEDNGKGIPDEEKKRIFDPGVKGKKSKGSGLGLYLVKKLIEGYGGRIEVKDAEPKGTAFIIYLPPAD